MRAMGSAREKLLLLRLYRMGGESRMEAELSAAAEGPDLVYQALESLTQETSTETTEKLGLAIRELAFGSERADLPLELQCEIPSYRGAVTASGNTKEDVERVPLSIGLRTRLWEAPREQRLYVICYEVLNRQVTRYCLRQSMPHFLPAHLEIIFDFGKVAWACLRKAEKIFQQLKESGHTWEQIRELE